MIDFCGILACVFTVEKSMVKDKKLLVGLDIGTTKVVALIGEVTVDGQVALIGVGSHPARGLKRGIVVNIEATVQSIQRAVGEAEKMAGCTIGSVYTGISGAHIRSLNSHGIVAIRHREVTQSDVDRVIDAAKAVAISADQKILHILPQEFVIDGQEGIKEPIGMAGVRLETKVHIVTGAVSAAQNIVKCVERCGLQVADIILEQLASSYAVLSEDEKELGVCMIDIGGGTTDIAIFVGGAIRHTAVIPIAGDQVTNDIAIALRTPSQYAEDLKIRHGCAISRLMDAKEMIAVPGAVKQSMREVSKRTLAEIVEARYEELFALVAAELRRSGLEEFIAAGYVLTGGASKIYGGAELAEAIFQAPVRLGSPQNIVIGMTDVVTSPVYATAVGLLIAAHQQGFEYEGVRRGNGDGLEGLWGRMKNWFKNNF